MTDTEQRAINARVLISQPFWNELKSHALELEHQSMRALMDAKHADASIVKGLQQRWLAVHDTINSLLRYPEAAIDAAKDATQQPVDYRSESANAQQGEQWQ